MRPAKAFLLLLIVVVCAAGLSQTNNATAVKTTGPCCPVVTGSNNTFHFEYCGNDPEQAKKMLEILKAISDSTEKLNAVMAAIRPPKIIVKKSEEISPPSNHPAWSIDFFLDRADENAQFGVLCDRACNPLKICTLPGPNSGILGHLAAKPETAVFLFNRQLPALVSCTISVESADEKPIKILGIEHLSITDGRMIVLNQTQPERCVFSGGGTVVC